MQWEFQVGPAVGISAGDEVWAARYILEVLYLVVLKLFTISIFNLARMLSLIVSLARLYSC